MTTIIPGGRGARTGEDANVGILESLDERVGRLGSTYDFRVLTSLGPTVSAGYTADTLYVALMPIVPYSINAKRASVTVLANNAAGRDAKVAIYRVLGQGRDNLQLVGGSEATFSGAATGLVSVDVDCTLTANTLYAIAWKTANATITWVGGGSTGTLSTQPRRHSFSSPYALDFPGKLTISSNTRSSSHAVLNVVYLSSLGKDLF